MVSDHEYCVALKRHYIENWGTEPIERRWKLGPVKDLGTDFRVLKFSPNENRKVWTFATLGMSSPTTVPTVEIYLLSTVPDDTQVEILTAIAHYHRTGARLDGGHTVNFGRPWVPGSACEYGLLSVPYLDGPKLEHLQTTAFSVRVLWLIPMTRAERDFKKQNGLEQLEERWESAQFDYSDPYRPSVIWTLAIIVELE
jgi:hypothetical protein